MTPHYPIITAQNKLRSAALANEAAERTTNQFTRQMWKNYASVLLREAHRLIHEVT